MDQKIYKILVSDIIPSISLSLNLTFLKLTFFKNWVCFFFSFGGKNIEVEIYGKDVRKEEDKASTGGKTCRIQDFPKYKEDVTKIHIVKNNLNQSCQFFF